MSSATRGDLPGRLIGMLVFFIGVGLLLMVFNIAYHLFTASPAELGIQISNQPRQNPSATDIGQAFGLLLIRILLLFVMSIAASLVAQKGVNLYFSGAQAGGGQAASKPAAAASAEA